MVINNLKKKSFQTAMTIDTNDITEEIYINVYEIAKILILHMSHQVFPKFMQPILQKKIHMNKLKYLDYMQLKLLRKVYYNL
jgi:hypothetical protein